MVKGAAYYSILMGSMMVATWSYLFIGNQFPAAKALPIETGYLLVAEFSTAVSLIIAGCAILARRAWGIPLCLVALGQLSYCTIRYAGELGQEGSTAGLIFFTTVAVLAIFFAVSLIVFSMTGLVHVL